VNSDSKIGCPSCNSPDIRRSIGRGMVDAVMLSLQRTPYRCRGCRRRFFRNTAKPVEALTQDKSPV
jgi:transposase-like protein